MVGPYFAFPDGLFDYSCAECGGLCCRGFGFGGRVESGQDPLDGLLERHPALAALLIRYDRGLAIFATPPNGCVFQALDGRCRIEADHDRAAKPGLCRAFPFSRIVRIGDTPVVAPNFLCPLRIVVPSRPGHVAGTHDHLAAELDACGFLSLEHRAVRLHASEQPGDALASETTLRDACGAAVGRRRFRETLWALAGASHGIEAFCRRAAALVGGEPGSGDRPDDVDTMLHAVAATLSLALFPLAFAGRLKALRLVEAMLRPVAALAGRPNDAKSTAALAGTIVSIAGLLAYDAEPCVPLVAMAARSGPPRFDDPTLTAAADAAVRLQQSGVGFLETLESVFTPSVSMLARVRLLRAVNEGRW